HSHPEENAYEYVPDDAVEPPEDGIGPRRPVARDHVRITDGRHEARELERIELTVAVEEDAPRLAGGREAGAERGAVAPVDRMPAPPPPRPPRHRRSRPVRAAVVDDDDLVAPRHRGQHRTQRIDDPPDVAGLVVGRDDGREAVEPTRGGHGAASGGTASPPSPGCSEGLVTGIWAGGGPGAAGGSWWWSVPR